MTITGGWRTLAILLYARVGLPFASPFCFLPSCYLHWEAWEMVEMMRRLARTR
jgi:hypothetical protein